MDFYNGTTLLGTDTTSPYTYSWTGVAAGTYGVKAIATDNVGATTTSTTASITVGTSGTTNSAPNVSMTSPATGASFLVGAIVPLTATASDSDGTVQKVEFYLGSLLLATDTTSPYSTTWPAVLGSFSVSAVATDDKGARTVSAWRDFVVTASAILGTAVFKPVTPVGAADYYVLEVFQAGANPNTAAPIATQNLGLPAVVAGECSADVRHHRGARVWQLHRHRGRWGRAATPQQLLLLHALTCSSAWGPSLSPATAPTDATTIAPMAAY